MMSATEIGQSLVIPDGNDHSELAAVTTNSGGAGQDSMLMTSRCYLKMIMHALRYPHAIVNGLLIMEKTGSGSKSNAKRTAKPRLVDCIPLFHSGHGLTPMLEVALNQVSDYYSKNTNLVIGGYYQANDYFPELPHPTPNLFAERIAEKIHETNPDSIVVLLSDLNLAKAIDDEPENLTTPLFLFQLNDGKLKLRSTAVVAKTAPLQLENARHTFDALQELIFRQKHHLNLVDFDSHLENVHYDWRNLKLNDKIDNCCNAEQQQ